jgi:hypothetical protein
MRNSTRGIIGVSALGAVTLLLHSFYYHESYPAWTSLFPQPATPLDSSSGRFDEDEHDPHQALWRFRDHVPPVRDHDDTGFPEGYKAPADRDPERPVFNWVEATQFVAFGDSFSKSSQRAELRSILMAATNL